MTSSEETPEEIIQRYAGYLSGRNIHADIEIAGDASNLSFSYRSNDFKLTVQEKSLTLSARMSVLPTTKRVDSSAPPLLQSLLVPTDRGVSMMGMTRVQLARDTLIFKILIDTGFQRDEGLFNDHIANIGDSIAHVRDVEDEHASRLREQ